MKKEEKLFTISAIIEYSGGKFERKMADATFREKTIKKALKAYAQFIKETVRDNKGKPVEKMEFTFSNEEKILEKSVISKEEI